MHHAGGDGRPQLDAEIPVGDAVDGVGAGGVKAQFLRRIEPVQRIGGTGQGAGAQGALGVHPCGGVLHAAQVPQQHPGVGHELVAEGHRLGPLQVGVAGHDIVGALGGLVADGPDQFFDLALDVGGSFPQVEAQIQRHLVVAAAAGVQPLARIPHPGGEGLFYEGVDILGGGVDLQRAAVQIIQDAVQAPVDVLYVLFRDDALPSQHGGVDQAALDILLDHPRVEADGGVEVIDAAVDGLAGAPLPKLRHKNPP